MERQVAIPAATQRGDARRGVILLVILSLLTLFMMLGVTYLVIASRARATARAFAVAANGSRNPITTGLGESFTDEAFFAVVRGSTNSTVTTGSNSLLGDKYGTVTPVEGTIVGSATGSLILSFTASMTSGSVEQLNGRVLTFQTPSLTSASVRILRAEPVAGSSNVKLFVQDGPTLSGVNLSSTAITNSVSGVAGPHFIVNGREFTGGTGGANESYDGFDSNNDFLADPLSPASRPSYSSTGGTLTIDNDGDGVLDSAWIDAGLPPFPDAAGNMIYPKAAVLITDLDGRLNVNAHGSRGTVDYSSLYPSTFATGSTSLTNVTTSTTSFATKSFAAYPTGYGFGPAETSLDQTTLFAGSSKAPTTATSWNTLTEGISASGAAVDPNTYRQAPNLGPVEGRYGSSPTTTGLPGKPDVNDPISSAAQGWIATVGSAYFTNPGRYGSPPDVRGRMRVFVNDFGQPVYYKPYWSGIVSSINQDEVVDDPYEVNLSGRGPRPGWSVNAAAHNHAKSFSYANVPDNLFSAAELEAGLRIFDADSRTLPQRLVALSGTQASGTRLLLTTDSWDSTAMTGSLRNNISTLITSATATVPLTGTSGMSAYEMFAPETLMGHKFDLNRPFHPTDPTEPYDDAGIGLAERQKFAKHLYSLLYVIAGGTTVTGSTAAQLAQWSVNVVDFRDADSVMTGFEYDKNLANGWTVNGDLEDNDDDGPDRAVVWGAERPEMLVTETVCWHDRKTDDTTAGTVPEDRVVTADVSKRDNDFDQVRRPQGAFFFELYSPWDSQLAEYDSTGIKAVRRTIQGGTSSLLRAEPIPTELAAGAVATGTSAAAGNALGRFDGGATLALSSTGTHGFPVWRVITLKTASSMPTVTDPATTLSGTVWRSFYFNQPPASLVRTSTNGDMASGSNAVAFWPAVSATSTISLSPQSPMVFGTGTGTALTGTTTTVVALDTIFLSATANYGTATTTLAATLTEPLITLGNNASYDPYEVLHKQSSTGTASWPLSTPNDSPLDNLTFAASGITAPLTGADNKSTLFQNGRHSNYFLLHLQRLANPLVAWNKDSNPYITIDTQPVDLLVYNTDSTGASNYEEPTVAPDSFTYTFNGYTKRSYTDGENASLTGTAATVSLERGNTQVTGTSDKDIWSPRINASGTNDAHKLLSISSTTLPASTITWVSQAKNGTGTGSEITWTTDNNGKLQDGTLVDVPDPAKSKHSLGLLAPRFSSGTAAPHVPGKPFPWMFWANRPFNSPVELAFVPKASPFQLLRLHATASGTGSDKLSTGWFGHLPRLFEPTVHDTGTTALQTPWDILAGRNSTTGSSNGGTSPSLWDAVHVPTPYGGGYSTLSLGTGTAATISGSAALSPLGLDKRPFGQVPTFREPGRVNVNTITGSTTWLAVLGSGTQIPTSSGSFTLFNTPAKSFMDVLQMTVSTSGTTFIDSFNEANRKTDANSFFRYQTVNRAANAVTTRSSVFAVWVTIGFFDGAGNEYGYDTGAIQRHRGFYIYDRSLPVGFSTGKDYNVRDGIMLRRIIP
jgi:hypothetical protein